MLGFSLKFIAVVVGLCVLGIVVVSAVAAAVLIVIRIAGWLEELILGGGYDGRRWSGEDDKNA